MMENAKMLIDEYVKLAEEILVEFSSHLVYNRTKSCSSFY